MKPIFTCPECNEAIEIGFAIEKGHKPTCSQNQEL